MIPFVGLASGLGAGNEGCQNGPIVIQENLPHFDWKAMILHNAWLFKVGESRRSMRS